MGRSNARGRDRAAARVSAAVTSFALDVEEDAILGDLRGSADVAFARQVAMYLCYVAFELSLTRVAAAFGRDRSTLAYACHTIEDRRDDVVFEQWVSALEMVLRGTPVVETGGRGLAVAS